MRAYSLDLRERIVQAVDQGYPRAEIIQLFGVSRATIKRYGKQRRETGHLRRKPIPGRPPQKSAPLQAQIVEQLEAHADATLHMHCDLWEHTSGVRVSTSTMSGVIRRVGWTRKKKTLGATERNEDARAEWREHRQNLDAKQLVVIDECGSNIGLTPLYARAPKGVRAYGKVPRNREKNTTVIAALTWSWMGEAMIIEGSATTLAFEQSMEVILAPSLSAGQIVILDNLAAHKSPKVEELIRQRGCQLLFLPGYSPDFSPIVRNILETQSVSASSGGPHTRSAPRSHWPGATNGNCARCARLVSALRVSPGSREASWEGLMGQIRSDRF